MIILWMHLETVNSSIHIKALLLFHNDAHNHKITGILKQLKILTVAPTCFGSHRNHHQGAMVNNIQAPSYKVAKFLNKKLQNLIQLPNTYTTKN
jgi:hypothetical protein